MKKRIFAMIFCVILAFTLTFSAFAADIERCTDAAGLLSDGEVAALNAKLDEMSERLQFDIAVVTMNELDGYDALDMAYAIWDEYHFGYGEYFDGVMLLISMEERDWAIAATGWGQDYIDEYTRSSISSDIVPYLSAGEYYEAFTLFADECEYYVTNYEQSYYDEEGDYYYYDKVDYKPPFDVFGNGMIALIAGVVIALIAVAIMKGKLKTVKSERTAANYVVDNSINLLDTRERFLYAHVTKTARPQNNTRSSGGGGVSHAGHSGSSGKF